MTKTSAGKVKKGKKATFTVRVGAPGLVPTGSVAFSFAGASRTVALSRGVAKVTVIPKAKGRKTATASYSGSGLVGNGVGRTKVTVKKK